MGKFAVDVNPMALIGAPLQSELSGELMGKLENSWEGERGLKGVVTAGGVELESRSTVLRTSPASAARIIVLFC